MKSLHRDAVGRIPCVFNDPDLPDNIKHHALLHARAKKPLQRHIILNDKNVNRILHLESDNKF